ncbi:hypothetical protein CARUB_v10003465mg [Capsella rubella]|uniref:Myb/SANT-like domain-containing protein n=1 Tax=Capsella rubella TaxID=81985 RepID=R0HG29_9BRAS|nr:L10-interacting MYB domain-containing protein [Capsella rubella]XP_023635800.1 L10-interacting MYB domain-containing protein [Capsella rubella]EOA22753.1 hypothetical protein CARUB_v10003465mg [Capsella rubella]
MSTLSRNGNERLRTVWTPEMDQYFIELMVEQVRKGNRFEDHLFSKRAWKFMSCSFTAKFKFPYGKDVLKNRHKTLRNLFKSLKNLLREDGFCWDETRQMVVADNCVWDEFLKVHPDLRSFRIKPIPYYKDLCLIYTDGMSEHKAEENNTEGETLIQEDEGYNRICESSTVTSNSKGGNITRCRTTWHPPMDRYFIDLMLGQAGRGNQIEGVFRKQAWTEMANLFNAKFESYFDVDVLKNRYKTLRRQFSAIKSLLRSDGFAWDDERQMVTADDNVWQDYIKAHRDARQFMTRPIPYYKDLCVLCGDSEIEENNCFVAMDWFDPETEFHEFKSGGTTTDLSISAEEEDSNSILLDHPKNKRDQLANTDTIPINPKKARVDETQSMAIEDAVEAIQALPDMDEELILDACDLLEDEIKAKTFLALDVKLRKKWLLRKLRPQVT